MRDGVFTGGNLFAVRIAVVEDCLAVAKKLVARRKNPLAPGPIVWPGAGLEISEWKTFHPGSGGPFCRMLGITGRAVISPLPSRGGCR